MSTPSVQEQTLLEHLQRAAELNVELEEYASVYEVDLPALIEAQAEQEEAVPRNDFVKVTISDDGAATAKVLCRLVHADGWSLECQAWPPAVWLRSLGELRS